MHASESALYCPHAMETKTPPRMLAAAKRGPWYVMTGQSKGASELPGASTVTVGSRARLQGETTDHLEEESVHVCHAHGVSDDNPNRGEGQRDHIDNELPRAGHII